MVLNKRVFLLGALCQPYAGHIFRKRKSLAYENHCGMASKLTRAIQQTRGRQLAMTGAAGPAMAGAAGAATAAACDKGHA